MQDAMSLTRVINLDQTRQRRSRLYESDRHRMEDAYATCDGDIKAAIVEFGMNLDDILFGRKLSTRLWTTRPSSCRQQTILISPLIFSLSYSLPKRIEYMKHIKHINTPYAPHAPYAPYAPHGNSLHRTTRFHQTSFQLDRARVDGQNFSRIQGRKQH